MSISPLGRIVEIAETGRHVARVDGFLTISAGREEVGRVALDDLVAIIATAPGTTTSCAAIAECSSRGIPFVICGRNFQPSCIVWPVAGHHAQQRRMECQLDTSLPLKKRLWATIISAKIRHQGSVLSEAGHEAGAFVAMARHVRSGDPENLEAQAARRYWPTLLGAGFRRDQDAEGVNALLNYGYAVLRAAVARAIVAAGLHPGLGIFHRHPLNSMPLADDLMEPFRPFVDRIVLSLVANGDMAVTPANKRELAAVLIYDLPTRHGMSPIGTCINRLAGSLGECMVAGVAELDLPLAYVALPCGPDDGPEP